MDKYQELCWWYKDTWYQQVALLGHVWNMAFCATINQFDTGLDQQRLLWRMHAATRFLFTSA